MIANPWVLLIAVVALGSITGGAYVKGRSDGADKVIAKQAREDEIRTEAIELARIGTAQELAKVKITHTTINRQAETVIRERKVYVECVNADDIVRLLNDARAGRAPSEPADSGLVPGAGASPTPDVR